MPKLLVIALSILALSACSKKKDNNKLPAELQAIVDAPGNCTCSPFINEYNWKGKTIFILSAFGDATIACDGIPAYYNKDGQMKDMTGKYDFTQFLLESKLIKTVWRCKTKQGE